MSWRLVAHPIADMALYCLVDISDGDVSPTSYWSVNINWWIPLSWFSMLSSTRG